MTTGSSPQGPRAHSRLAEIIVACAAFTKAPVPRARPRPDAFDVSDLVPRLSCDLGRQMLVAVFVVGKLRATCQLRLKLITTGHTSSGSSLRSCWSVLTVDNAARTSSGCWKAPVPGKSGTLFPG